MTRSRPRPYPPRVRLVRVITNDHDGVFDLAERLCVLAVEDPEMRDDQEKETETMTPLTNKSCTHKIWMAGDATLAKIIVRKYCDKIGDCYAVTTVDYIYTDGDEAGFCVSRIQYPRFPISEADILKRTNELAKLLCEGLCQKSYTVEGPSNTVWFSGDDDEH